MANNASTNTTNNSAQGNNAVVGDDSFDIARRLPNDIKGRITIEGSAPWRQDNLVGNRELGRAGQEFPGGGLTHDVRNTAVVKIDVQVLQQNELGLLNATGEKLKQNLATALQAKQAEDERKYDLTPAQMVQKSKDLGYHGSGAHQAWAEAASARTGGRASPEYMMKLDPLGGTNGNGPKIELGGIYPHPLSRIAMGHDTDWSLGRYFNAGPMNGLYGNKADDKNLGLYGLDGIDPTNLRSNVKPPSKAQYGYGNDIYKVEYNNYPTELKRSAIDGNDAVVVASIKDSTAVKNGLDGTGLEKHASQLNKALDATGIAADKREDAVAAVLKNTVDAKFDPKADVNLAQSTKDPNVLIASQGQSPSMLRADPVDVSKVQPGSAQTVTAELVKNNGAQQQVASNTVDQVEQKNPTRGGLV
jgi:hypothetical protein